MPTYVYVCKPCDGEPFERELPVVERNSVCCPTCFSPATRRFVAPHVAPIGGIPNRLNLGWDEGDRRSKTFDTTGRGKEQRAARMEKRRKREERAERAGKR